MILQTPCQRRGKVTLVAFVLLLLRIHSRIRCICLIFLHCALSNDPSNSVLRRGIVTLVAFVLLFSTVRFQMFLQTPYLRRGIVALFALDLSLLCIFCMLPQMAIIRVSIVTLVAFVLLFSTVRFPRLPQMAFIRGCRVA